MKLWNNDDVRTTFTIFLQHSSRGPIELNDLLDKSFQDIREILIQHMAYEEIKACRDKPHEDLSLAHP